MSQEIDRKVVRTVYFRAIESEINCLSARLGVSKREKAGANVLACLASHLDVLFAYSLLTAHENGEISRARERKRGNEGDR